MTTRFSAALIALGAIALSSCSIEEDAASPSPTTEAEETTTASEPNHSVEVDEELEEEEEEEDRFGPRIENERGNLVKEIGQLAGITSLGVEEPTVEFTVTAIEPGFQCTADYANPPLNGNFIAVSFEVQTTAALAQAPIPAFYLTEYDLNIISPEGVRENDSVGNGYSCLKASEALPPRIGPSEKAIGTIVLDSAHSTGHLVVTQDAGAIGWEWTF